MSRPTLLVPVIFPDPDAHPLDDANIVGLSGFDVVLFGYWELPEGVSRETARETKAPEAQAVLYEVAAAFSRGGASTSVSLHFGNPGAEEAAFQERIASETDADAVLVGGQITMWNNVLVPLRDERHRPELLEFLSGFQSDSIFTIELYHVADDRGAVDRAEAMLESVRADLLDAGFAADTLEVTVVVDEDAGDAIADRAQRHNLVVMGETGERDDESEFLGAVYDTLADQADVPIVVLLD